MLKDNVDKLFKEGLENAEVAPPDYVWTGIHDRLSEHKRTKRALVVWRSIAAVALLFLSVGTLFYVSNEMNSYEVPNLGATLNTDTASLIDVAPIVKDASDAQTETLEDAASHYSKVTGETTQPGANNRADVQLAENVNRETGDTETLSLMAYLGIRPSDDQASSIVASHLKPVRQHDSPAPDYVNVPLLVNNPPPMKIRNKKRLTLGGVVSPTYNYRDVGGAQPAYNRSGVANAMTNESALLAVSGGLSLKMSGKSKWSFETGVLYSQIGQQVSQPVSGANEYSGLNNLAYTNVALNNSMGAIELNSQPAKSLNSSVHPDANFVMVNTDVTLNAGQATIIKQTLDYLEIPLMVRYAVFEGAPLVSLAGGVSTNFLIDNNAYLVNGGTQTNIGETRGINDVSYSTTLGVGVELPVGQSFRFSLEPRFKYFMVPVNTSGTSRVHPYSFGVFGGVSFTFK
jgi:hypothetical protein